MARIRVLPIAIDNPVALRKIPQRLLIDLQNTQTFAIHVVFFTVFRIK